MLVVGLKLVLGRPREQLVGRGLVLGIRLRVVERVRGLAVGACELDRCADREVAWIDVDLDRFADDVRFALVDDERAAGGWRRRSSCAEGELRAAGAEG